ncbi:hypothetical protein D7X33_15905 [Butyricicoccus sp. 1XD8-22]|nr:hypothetical protein D7X33_15905 [Butyricicoccus sp. 1XD8-22]
MRRLCAAKSKLQSRRSGKKLKRSKEKPLASLCQRLFVRLSAKWESTYTFAQTGPGPPPFWRAGALSSIKDGQATKAPSRPQAERDAKHLGA